MTLGWTRVKIELLRKRPVQCFQCWHFGHARSNCRSEISRKGSCFRCGQTDHLASTCKVARPKCLICEEIGKEYRHRIGSQRCLKNHGFPGGAVSIKKKVLNSTKLVSQSSDLDDGRR